MFDEAPPSSSQTSTTATPSSEAGGSTVVVQASGSGGPGGGQQPRNSRGKMRMQKTKSAKNSNSSSAKNEQNGHTSSKSGTTTVDDNEVSTDSSDLEDALGSPNECTAALVRKVRRKSGLNTFDKELMRIVGQHLHSIGLKTSADVLMAEAGMQLIHPTASNFKKLVLNGEWSQAVRST